MGPGGATPVYALTTVCGVPLDLAWIDDAPPELPLALREVLGVPVRLLAEFPRPTTLTLRVAPLDPELLVVWTTSADRYRLEVAAGRPVFSPIEYELVAALAEAAGAAAAEDWRRWCATKARSPRWRVTDEVKEQPPARGWGWPLRRVLAELGTELVQVEVDDEVLGRVA